MGTLVFVGAGLGGIDSMSAEALEAIKDSESVFLETYTTFVGAGLAGEIEARTGRSVQGIGRAEAERGDSLLRAAENGRTALIVGGESMSATTHLSLRIEAVKRGIATSIIFAPSIITAAPSLLGLHQYKFGRTVSIPRFRPGYRPFSPFENIESNLKGGMHTLALLDVDAEQGYYMSPSEAFGEMAEFSLETSSRLLTKDTLVCTVSRAGRKDAAVMAGRLGKLIHASFGAPPHCVVVPSKLHFQESEGLVLFAGADRDDMEGLAD